MWDCKTSKMSQSPLAALNAFGLFAAVTVAAGESFATHGGKSEGLSSTLHLRRLASNQDAGAECRFELCEGTVTECEDGLSVCGRSGCP
jgi:hypothetical protein